MSLTTEVLDLRFASRLVEVEDDRIRVAFPQKVDNCLVLRSECTSCLWLFIVRRRAWLGITLCRNRTGCRSMKRTVGSLRIWPTYAHAKASACFCKMTSGSFYSRGRKWTRAFDSSLACKWGAIMLAAANPKNTASVGQSRTTIEPAAHLQWRCNLLFCN